MNEKNTHKKLIPELRFPEFQNDGEWVVDKFSSFITLYRGSSPRPINQFLTKKKNGVNWIKIGDTQNAKNFKISRVEEKITIEGSKKSRKVTKGELILANSMSYGATYELEIDGCIYDGWFVLREYENSFNKQFLLQLLNSNILQIQYKRLAAGGIVKNISSDIVYNTLLPKPSKQEQQKIAAFLSNLDELIAAHKQKLALLKQHKKGLMQKLFPQEGEKVPEWRFPEFQNDGEWVEKRLGDIYTFKSTNSFSRNKLNYDKGYIKNIHYGDIHTKFSTLFDITKENVPFVNDDISIERINHDSFCVEGDIVIADASEDLEDVGKSIEIVNLNNEKVLSGLHTILARQIEYKLIVGFGGYLFKSNFIRNQIKNEAQGAKVLGISKGRISKINICYPQNKKEQQKIAAFLSNLDELITAQAEKIEQLERHKKGLMQRMFPIV